ncbi:PAS domain-containing sensor histidine kinase [Methylobacterium gregans]|uniref:histidine kinase n=1 Tax=Methylobacterium gregans TaxID=374424 RepID=A0AA37MBI7_9HYPH|nr:PAS domain-containing sensor histidine kinase [Methylobacterium gregans]MDQ0521144.1 PAS domain S-box-containing protein [Methylobacterium gregans]GJD79128.1 Sensor histidine kinase RcsC [Methylobacterium gregans]
MSAELAAARARIAELEARLEESEDTLAAIRRGDFDAVVVEGPNGERLVYTLENADRPYRVLIEQIQEGAFTLSAEGTVLYGNRRLAAMLGLRQERLIGQLLRRFVLPQDAETLDALVAEAAGTPARAEIGFRDAEGTLHPVHLSLARLERDGEDPLLCGVLTDLTEQRGRLDELAAANARLTAEITERERIEDALRQSQKMEAVGQLTGGVAHDFNNLLTVIKSSTDLLKRRELPEERRARYVLAISDTVDRAAKLTGQLLAFARRQALQPETFDAGASVAAIGDMVGTLTGARIRVSVRLPDQPCYVHADPSQFDTALVNIAVNARDAMEGEGTLTIEVAATEAVPASRGQMPVRGRFVAVSVNDTGTGIAPEVLARIFEPFFTTKGVGQGTGLGLSQVFGFAKQSGGEVTVDSAVGHGTTFTLYLPRAEAPAAAALQSGPALAPGSGQGTCVLVVEDNAEVGSFATQTLAELGYATVWVRDADAAVAALEREPARFDVVFSDVVMPGRDGVDLAGEIRRRWPDVPVLLTSGYSHVLAQEGTHGFELLHKPYSVEQLSHVLSRVVAARRRAG